MDVRFKSKYSLASQIEEKLIEYIEAGVYGVDEKLPSIRELAVELKVNPNTVAKVYISLEEKGIIYSLLKKGYYVSPKTVTCKADLSGLKVEIEKAIKSVGILETRRYIEEILNKEDKSRD